MEVGLYDNSTYILTSGNTSDVWMNETDGFHVSLNVTEEPDCSLYDFIVSGVLLGIICLIGYVGNILTIITLSLQRKTGTRILLQALAFVDTLLLMPALFVKCVPNCCLYAADYGEACFTFWFYIYPYLASYFWPVGTIAHCSSVWITVLLAGTRYIAVCRPLHAKTLTRIPYVSIQLAIVITFSILYCIPRFFEYQILVMVHPLEQVTINIASYSDLFKNTTYQIVYRNISFFLLMSIIPLIVITVFTIFLVRAVWKARKARLAMTPRSNIQAAFSVKNNNNMKEESSLTFTLIIVVVVFFICQIPAAVTRVFYMTSPDLVNKCGHFYSYFGHLSDVLVFLNSSVNFIIYCLCSSKFRKDLRKICMLSYTCCRSKTSASVNGCGPSTNTWTLRSMPTAICNGRGVYKGGLDTHLPPATLSSMASLPSVLSLGGDLEEAVEVGARKEPDGISYVSQETIITHL